MSEAPSDTNSLDYGMSPGMAGDLSDSDLPSTQGERFAELPTDGPPPTVEVPAYAADFQQICGNIPGMGSAMAPLNVASRPWSRQ